jgi:hypothetical protein
MRALACAALLCLGCNDGQAPPGWDASASVDQGPSDLLVIDVDAGPRACTTACDCSSGERCAEGVCATGSVPIYCCGTAACTGDNLCQDPNGEVSQCGLPGDAGVRPAGDGGAGTGPGCGMTTCTKGLTGDLLCQLACGKTTSKCVDKSGGSGAHCMP